MRTPYALMALALVPLPTAVGHEPPGPTFACDATQELHDMVGPGIYLAETGPTGRRGAGNGRVQDSNNECAPGTYCPVTGDDPLCVPIGTETDDDYETGQGYALLPAAHHGPTLALALGTPTLGPITLVVGVDGNGDGLLDGQSASDCIEYFLLESGSGSVTTGCAVATTGAYPVYAACRAASGDDGQLWTGGDPVLRNPIRVNSQWDPDPIAPTTADPEVGCYVTGHVG